MLRRLTTLRTPEDNWGVRPDVGHSIDGQSGSNTLAYNYFPNNGDMVIDTDNINFYSNGGSNFLRLRNVLAHEFGHGMGLPHYESNDSRGLMEPFIDLSFDGPQIDDIYQAQRRYGDSFEENGGNDTTGTAITLGTFDGTIIELGMDADQDVFTEINPNQVDFVSIDGDDDIDIWSFSLDSGFEMTFDLDMLGPTFNRGPQDGAQSSYNMAAQSDLDLELLSSDGSVLASSMIAGLDMSEQIVLELDAGSYFLRVTGRDDEAQFYSLSLSGFEAIPEPSSCVILLGLAGLTAAGRRRSV